MWQSSSGNIIYCVYTNGHRCMIARTGAVGYVHMVTYSRASFRVRLTGSEIRSPWVDQHG